MELNPMKKHRKKIKAKAKAKAVKRAKKPAKATTIKTKTVKSVEILRKNPSKPTIQQYPYSVRVVTFDPIDLLNDSGSEQDVIFKFGEGEKYATREAATRAAKLYIKLRRRMKRNPNRRRHARKLKCNPIRRRPASRRKVRRTAKRRSSSTAAGYVAIRGGGGIMLCKVQNSRMTRVGTFTMARLKAYCKKHGIRCK